MDFPDSPEAVALALLGMVVVYSKAQGREGDNRSPAQWVLDTFDECLRAVKGERNFDRAVRH